MPARNQLPPPEVARAIDKEQAMQVGTRSSGLAELAAHVLDKCDHAFELRAVFGVRASLFT
jgi:hypothetical protein